MTVYEYDLYSVSNMKIYLANLFKQIAFQMLSGLLMSDKDAPKKIMVAQTILVKYLFLFSLVLSSQAPVIASQALLELCIGQT